ncbi:hypothetical protein M3583_26030, partial [Bacillus subtilis]|nr:hypothetical protein [Bacillus subtilis]
LRLDAASITMPPLRERDGDALAIADAQIDELTREARATGRSTTDKRAAPGFVRECLSYEWPGNVRELRNLAERVGVTVRQTGGWDAARLQRLIAHARSAAQPVPAESAAEVVVDRSKWDMNERNRVIAAL